MQNVAVNNGGIYKPIENAHPWSVIPPAHSVFFCELIKIIYSFVMLLVLLCNVWNRNLDLSVANSAHCSTSDMRFVKIWGKSNRFRIHPHSCGHEDIVSNCNVLCCPLTILSGFFTLGGVYFLIDLRVTHANILWLWRWCRTGILV